LPLFARAHKGCLEFDSEPVKGTRVLVKFQCLNDVAARRSDSLTAKE
jgi:hypothetical protein